MSKTEKDGNWFKRHKVMTVILALIAIGVAGSAAGSGGKKKDDATTSSSTSSSNSTSNSKATTVAKVGEAVRDGKFEFTVKNVKCGVASVADNSGYLTKSAQGQYCLVELSVKNISTKSQTFLESDQKLLNASSVEYSADSTATLYNSNSSDVFVNEINPGNTVEGTLVYDLPKDQTPTTAELHDSSLSNGVKVTLQ